MASDTTLHQLLKQMVEMAASDLHLTTNSPPMVRLDGRLIPLPYPPMTVSETKHLAYSVLTDSQKHRFEESLELDFSFGVKGLARFRANNFMQRLSLIHISEPTRLGMISYAVFCLKK